MRDKLDEIYTLVKKRDDDNDNKLICLLAVIGGIVIVALIAYAVYRFLKCIVVQNHKRYA